MDQNFWVFVSLGLLIFLPFVVIIAKALGAGRKPTQGAPSAAPAKRVTDNE